MTDTLNAYCVEQFIMGLLDKLMSKLVDMPERVFLASDRNLSKFKLRSLLDLLRSDNCGIRQILNKVSIISFFSVVTNEQLITQSKVQDLVGVPIPSRQSI